MKNLREMLEHMSHMGVVVISKGAHTVLYANATFKNAYPAAEDGAQVQAVIGEDEDARKLFGLLDDRDSGLSAETRYRLYLMNFGGSTDVCIDEFEWEGVPAYVLYFTLVYLNEEEKYQAELSKVIEDTVSFVYPFVSVIDLSDNTSLVLAAEEGALISKGEHGNFEDMMKRIGREIHPDYREEYAQKTNVSYILDVFSKNQQEVHLEFRMKRPGGKYYWMAMRFVRVHTADKHRVSCVGLMRNIDYRKDLQHKLQATLDAAYAAIPGGVIQFIAEGDMRIVHVNEEFCKLAEKTPDDYYKGGYILHVLPEDRQRVCDTICEKAKNGEPFDVTYRIRMGKSGRVRWVQLCGVKIDDMEGKPVYLGIRMDVTELKNAQINLLEEQARADLAMGATGIIRFEYDRKEDVLTMRYPVAEAKDARTKVYSLENYCDKIRERDEVHPEDIDKMVSVFMGDNREAVEIRLKYGKMTEYQWYSIKSKEIHDADGHIYIVGILENITKKKKLEHTNAQLLEQMGVMFQDSFQRMYIIDIAANTCQVIRLGIEHTRRRPLIRKLTRIVAAYERTRIYPADLDNFRAKCMYLKSPSAFTKGRNEVYFDIRVRDGLGPEYHWYTMLIRRAQQDEGKLICLAKCVDELKRQESLQRKYIEQMKYQKFSEQIIDSLGTIVEFRDSDSGEHILRTKQLTKILLTYLSDNDPEYHLTEDKIEKITMAAAMHDVGKISIPDAILNKPGRLTPEEYEIMKTHTTKGYDILNSIEIGQDNEFGCYCREICRYHHERYDGKGYPDHLCGDEIPIWGQIVSIVDVYDALVSPRVYKPAYGHEKAVRMIMNGECGSFNPKLLEGLTACADKLRACYE